VRQKSLSFIISELAEHKEEIQVGEFGGIWTIFMATRRQKTTLLCVDTQYFYSINFKLIDKKYAILVFLSILY